MPKFAIIVSVDEDTVKRVSEQNDLIDAVTQEAGWMHDSGIFVDSIEMIEE